MNEHAIRREVDVHMIRRQGGLQDASQERTVRSPSIVQKKGKKGEIAKSVSESVKSVENYLIQSTASRVLMGQLAM